MTDQVESQKVAAIHQARKQPLPVVTLKPDAGEPSDEITVDSSGEEIVFEGDARSRRSHAHGPAHRRHATSFRTAQRRASDADTRMRSAAKTPMPPPSSDENLGVAPVPPIRGGATTPPPPRPSTRRPPPSRSRSTRAPTTTCAPASHDAAERGFREFVRRYPHHDYADNAQYWLGECFYDQRAYDKAAPEFRAVVQRWPTGNKAPDAMLKLGFSLLRDRRRRQGSRRAARAARRPIRAPKRRASRPSGCAQLRLTTTEGLK